MKRELKAFQIASDTVEVGIVSVRVKVILDTGIGMMGAATPVVRAKIPTPEAAQKLHLLLFQVCWGCWYGKGIE